MPEGGREYHFEIADIEFHGVHESGEPFVGSPEWDSLTISNHYGKDHWSPDLGRERGSNDAHIYAAGYLMHVRTENKGRKDIVAEVFATLEATIAEFRALLDSNPEELVVQRFLEQHTVLLASDAVKITPQFRLGGDFIADFVIEYPDQQYILVEIEAPGHRLYTKAGDPMAILGHAQKQMEDWRDWIDETPDYARKLLPGISEPECWLVIGRRPTERAERRAFERKKRHLHGFRLFTYDDLLDTATRQLTNLRAVALA